MTWVSWVKLRILVFVAFVTNVFDVVVDLVLAVEVSICKKLRQISKIYIFMMTVVEFHSVAETIQ